MGVFKNIIISIIKNVILVINLLYFNLLVTLDTVKAGRLANEMELKRIKDKCTYVI
jgi:hypothetical protein